jgi:primary-amine oxidase
MAALDRWNESDENLSRRGFLGRSTLAAGVLGSVGFLASRGAADGADPPDEKHEAMRHPLDPLSADEIAAAVKVVREAKSLGDSCRFVTVSLAEPPREILDAFRPGRPFPREAAVLLMHSAVARSYEAVVDLKAGALRSYEPLAEGLQPLIVADEFVDCDAAVKKCPEFLEALRKRGVTDPSLVLVDAWSAGMYGNERPEERGKRLVRALAFVRSGPGEMAYARPLEGVVAVLDLHAMKVLRIEDYGVVPLPEEPARWAGSDLPPPRPGLKPLSVEQPDGPSFTVEGRQVSWQGWTFRIGFAPREGLVLHDIVFRHGGQERPLLRRAAISEMVVPYGDPAEKHYRENAFDIGEYGIGTMLNPLAPGCDCLGSICYFDAHICDGKGRPATLASAICLHEEDAGILWKHTDWTSKTTETRRARRLSVSVFATVGNYDYGFYWHFYQDGAIQCEVKLTGVMHTTALAEGETPRYGVEVAPRLNAPFHQHVFATRLDFCVDGPKNAFYEVNMVSPPRGPENPHGNGFRAEEELLAREKDARRRVNTASSRFWRVVNHSKKNRFGHPVAYRLVPGENAPPFVQTDAAVLKRAGFAEYNLWVTPYDRDQRYAAGEYPNQHPTGDGLPTWTAADRSVADTELVAWYVFAHTHVPRPEDWPVMPSNALGFWLKPDGFFDRNPALDVPAPKV